MAIIFLKSKCRHPGDASKTIYSPKVRSIGSVDTEELCTKICNQCSATPADVHGYIHALGDFILSAVENNYAVKVDGLGTFAGYLKADIVGAEDQWRSVYVRDVKIGFRPDKELKEALMKEGIRFSHNEDDFE